MVLGADGPGPLGRRYWQLWSSSGLSNVADGVLQVALPLVAITYTTNPGQIAGVALAGRLPWLLFALQAGAISDRHDRRKIMLGANVGRATLLAVLAVLVAFEGGGIAVLYVVAFAIGICETLYDTSAQSILPQVVEKDQLSKANGRLYAIELTGQSFIGPPLGGLLMAIGAALALGGSSLAWFFAAGVLFFVRGTYRPAEASVHEHPLLRAKHTLQLRRRCTEIALEYLTRAEVQAYLDGRFPGAGFPGALADLIHAQTDGNPLFVGAVIDQLVTRGWLLDTEPGWSLAVPLETLRLEVPDDLREMIRFQFQAMGPLDRSLLEAASVIADAFTADDVAQTIAAELLAVESSCEQLVRTHRFLRIVDDAAMPDGTARHYAFRHALYKHVVYEEIPAAKRRGLHLRVGEALESAHADGSARNTFRLAAHFERGGDPVRAIAYSAAAAAEAQRRFAPREAISCLEAALALTPQLHDEKEARQREIELRVALTAALNLVHGYASEEVRESCERTRTLCEQTASLPELYEALYALWYSQAMRAERDTTRETTKQLAEVAERLGGPEPRLRAATTRGQIALYEGRFQEASDTLTEAIDRWEARSGTAEGGTYGPDPVMAANANLALALWFLGYPESARSTHRKTLSMAQQSGLPFDLAAALVHISFVELLCGNGSEALRFADRGLALATEHGFPMWQTFATGFRGWARMDLGEPAAGVEDVRAAIAGLESGGVKLMKPVLLAGLAGSGLRLGIPSEGLAAVDEGLRLMPTILDRFYEPELWRLKGELLLSRPADRKTARSPSRDRLRREAEECFRTALKIAQERGSRSLELRAAMSLARLEKMLGERGSAYDLLAAVHGWFTEGFDTGDLIQAKDLLEAPGHGSRTVRSRGARTTSRL